MADQTETLKVGDKAPDFKLRSTENTEFKLSEQSGKNVVLNFFPAAFSGVCSNQMTDIEANKGRFGDDTVVVGISVDNTWSLAAFKKERGIDFPLLSDFYPHGAVSQEYGLLYPNGTSHRAVVGIDKEGVVRYIDDHAPLEVPELESCAVALGK
jgi:peroxiredoxin (alkyl hydroperoxide reductase subunit C)